MSGGHHADTKFHTIVAKPHPPRAFYRYGSIFLGATLWFWMFYRIKTDGKVMFGLEHPWDSHGHAHSKEEHK